MEARLYSVSEVFLNSETGDVPTISLSASGFAATSGWKDATLVAYVYIMPPKDGIWDFDLIATIPSGMSNEVISPMISETLKIATPPWFKGVRIHAATNKLESTTQISQRNSDLSGDFKHTNAIEGVDAWPWKIVVRNSGGVSPWPWSVSPKRNLENDFETLTTPEGSIGSLIGSFVRTYEEGAPITEDHRPNRINFVTSKTSHQIIKIYRG